MEPRYNTGIRPHGVETTPDQLSEQSARTGDYTELNSLIDGHFKQLAAKLDTLREPDEERIEQLHDGMLNQLNSLRDE